MTPEPSDCISGLKAEIVKWPPKQAAKISTGYAALDGLLRGGMKTGAVHSLIGRESVILSRFCINLINNWAWGVRGQPGQPRVCFYSLRDDAANCLHQLLENQTGVAYGKMAAGTLALWPDDVKKVQDALSVLDDGRLVLHDPVCLGITDVQAVIETARVENGADIVMVDGLDVLSGPSHPLMTHPGYGHRHVLDAVLRAARHTAREYNVAVLFTACFASDAEAPHPIALGDLLPHFFGSENTLRIEGPNWPRQIEIHVYEGGLDFETRGHVKLVKGDVGMRFVEEAAADACGQANRSATGA